MGDITLHTIVEHDAKEPTCTEKGYDEYVTCTVCGYSTYDEKTEKAATGHTLEYKVSEDDTKHYQACTNCSYKTEEASHTFGEWGKSSENGYIERKCTDCAYVEKIKGVVVATAAELKAAVTVANSKIKLIADITLDNYLTISKSIELDGNGHTLTIGCKSADYGASGLYITGEDVETVLVKDITLKAGSNYPSQTALVYIHYCSADVALENVVMECNPDGNLTTLPIGVQSVYREKGKISVKGCTINGAKYGMYFNSISDGAIENNTIDGTLYNGIVLAGDNTDNKYDIKNVVIKDNTLKNIASRNFVHIAYNCGIYIGEHTSNITVEGNSVTLAGTCTDGKEIVYYKDLITTEAGLKAFFTSSEAKTGYLYSSVTLTEDITSTGTKVLNLCGNTITSAKKITNAKGGDLTIKNGTIDFDITSSERMHVFNNSDGATFTASGLTLDVEFVDTTTTETEFVGFSNRGKAIFKDNSIIKVVSKTNNGTAGYGKILGVFSYDGENGCSVEVYDSTIKVVSNSIASSYGFYIYLNKGDWAKNNKYKGVLKNSTVTVVQSTVGSVTPVFAESKDDTNESVIDITNCKIQGISSVTSNKTSEESQKYVYAVRAKGLGVINIDAASKSGCSIIAADVAAEKNVLAEELSDINNKTGVINER